MPYSPDTNYFYVPGTIRTSVFERFARQYHRGKIYTGGSQEAADHTPLAGTFTAIDAKTNKIAWQHNMSYRMGGGSGSTATAGRLLFRGEPDGNFVAVDAKTGEILWKFQTGFGPDAPPVVYEADGDQYIAIATGGNSIQRSATGDAVWAFSLKGQLGPAWWPPTPPSTTAGPGPWWGLWFAVSSLWRGHGHDGHLEEPSDQRARGDRGDRGDRGE
jgi:alcohol dehydrogenase (cytochrome c)